MKKEIVFAHECISFASSLLNRSQRKHQAKQSARSSASGEQKQKEVLDSIQYAKRIQVSLLPTDIYRESAV